MSTYRFGNSAFLEIRMVLANRAHAQQYIIQGYTQTGLTALVSQLASRRNEVMYWSSFFWDKLLFFK